MNWLLQGLPSDLQSARMAGILPIALTAVLLASTLEGLVKTFVVRRPYDWRAYAASLADSVLRRLLGALHWSWTLPILQWTCSHPLLRLDTQAWWTWLLLFMGQEFCYYWYHRSAHHIRWFWATHAVHHSPTELTWANALRLGLTGPLTGTTLFFLPLTWMGFTPYQVLACLSLNLAYQFWLHADWIPKLGPLEWVFNTPSHHRAHHGRQARYLDCNFGGVLIIFDRLFGSFVEESALEPPRYGLTRQLHSHNPVKIAFHEWLNLAADLRFAKTWPQRWQALFGRPGQHISRPS